jgi:hypothetical protein
MYLAIAESNGQKIYWDAVEKGVYMDGSMVERFDIPSLVDYLENRPSQAFWKSLI